MVSFFKKMNSATAELKKLGKWNRLELVEELNEFVRGCSGQITNTEWVWFQ